MKTVEGWQLVVLALAFAAWVMVTIGAIDPVKGDYMRAVLRLLWPWRNRDRD